MSKTNEDERIARVYGGRFEETNNCAFFKVSFKTAEGRALFIKRRIPQGLNYVAASLPNRDGRYVLVF